MFYRRLIRSVVVFFSFFNSVRKTYWKLFSSGPDDGNDEDIPDNDGGTRKTTSAAQKDFVEEVQGKWSIYRTINTLASGRIEQWEYVLSLNTIFVYNLLLFHMEEAELQNAMMK